MDLILDAKLLYKLLCILFKIEFNVFKKLFAKKSDFELYTRIYELCKRINALRFKKTIIFDFYINYKELNIFVIKNKYSLSLIDETLNRFINAVYFIKLKFKKIYHLNKRCKSNK